MCFARLAPVVVVVGLVACGRSPAAPSTPSSTAFDATSTAAVTTTVSSALSQSALGGLTGLGTDGLTFTYPCPDGGTVTTTLSSTPPAADGFSGTSRTEFNDCRSKTVVMRGDPYLMSRMDVKTTGAFPGPTATLTMTMQTTGGVRMTSNGVEGRMQYNCSSVFTGTLGSQTVPQFTSAGTITWETPIGSTPRITPCGPAAP